MALSLGAKSAQGCNLEDACGLRNLNSLECVMDFKKNAAQ